MIKQMYLSKDKKEILDKILDELEIERAFCIKLSLAKGIEHFRGFDLVSYKSGRKNHWEIPKSIISNEELLLFQHLIFNELNKSIPDEELTIYLNGLIDHGLSILQNKSTEKNSLEDFRISVLSD
ncbi:hypothetical protein SAMN05421839_10533 [Halolactibacillus halophilus]|uniref:Uncharacterized protein n=1 Tax=Halolactibacillus halophilus TaxID=306540 RepID=A0A1I5MCW3_9BACI|nr:hypothetical protein [Halolactibacillus halophilus]GEM02086.1 hypothetical protein HHA03_16180 [Halolactibacillus halophilus]SFP07444.1 hypothetical protein SAMN05421839_10533 [Halolactibacillus halophilus]